MNRPIRCARPDQRRASRLACAVISQVSGPIESPSRRSSRDEIELRAQTLGRRLCLTVSDHARRGFAPVALTPDDAREDGRGLQIVSRLADWRERIADGRRELYAELVL